MLKKIPTETTNVPKQDPQEKSTQESSTGKETIGETNQSNITFHDADAKKELEQNRKNRPRNQNA